MEPDPEPPKLEYAVPEVKPVTPTHPVVGVLGFVVYALSLLFSLGMLSAAYEVFRFGFRRGMQLPLTILTLIWMFCVWRAFAALHGVIRKRKS